MKLRLYDENGVKIHQTSFESNLIAFFVTDSKFFWKIKFKLKKMNFLNK